jgi:hypothetical protein
VRPCSREFNLHTHGSREVGIECLTCAWLGAAGDNEERTTFNKRTSRQLRRGKMSSGNEKLSSGVVDLPPGDAIVANSKKSETLGNGKIEIDSGDASNVLQCVYDIFNGVIVDPDCLPPDVPTFVTCLTTSIALWKQQVYHAQNYS